MIIYGSRGFDSEIDQRTFFCPNCNNNSNASIKEVKRYFTLYFIPLFPIGSAGVYVECQRCHSQYDEEILHIGAEQLGGNNHEQLLRVMIMAALADGQVDDGERQAINKHYAELSGMPVPPSEMETEINLARQSGVTLSEFVKGFADRLSDPQKGSVVTAAFRAMAGSGALQKGHKQQLSALANTLKIPKEHFMDLLKRLNQT